MELSEGNGLLLEGLVVDCNAEGDSDFVRSGVALSDGLASVINLAGDQVSLQSQLCIGQVVLMSAMIGSNLWSP